MKKQHFQKGLFWGLGIGVAILIISWLKPVRETVIKKITPKEEEKKQVDPPVKEPVTTSIDPILTQAMLKRI